MVLKRISLFFLFIDSFQSSVEFCFFVFCVVFFGFRIRWTVSPFRHLVWFVIVFIFSFFKLLFSFHLKFRQTRCGFDFDDESLTKHNKTKKNKNVICDTEIRDSKCNDSNVYWKPSHKYFAMCFLHFVTFLLAADKNWYIYILCAHRYDGKLSDVIGELSTICIRIFGACSRINLTIIIIIFYDINKMYSDENLSECETSLNWKLFLAFSVFIF